MMAEMPMTNGQLGVRMCKRSIGDRWMKERAKELSGDVLEDQDASTCLVSVVGRLCLFAKREEDRLKECFSFFFFW